MTVTSNQNLQENVKRECGSCTECCQGWLSGQAQGKQFYSGHPCHYVCEKGCSIYENRPENPCKTFECEWLRNNDVPEWMKPDKCKVIIVTREWSYEGESQGFFIDVAEAGQQIDSRILAWLFTSYLNTNVPMRVQVAGGHRWYGNEKFLEHMGSLYQ
jgi:hypothetical protein